MPMISVQVQNDASDVNWGAGSAQVTGDNYHTIGNNGSPIHTGDRFTGVTIPQGATISAADYLLYLSAFGNSGGPVSFKVHCENADNAAAWTAANGATAALELENKALTTGSVFSQTNPPTAGYRTLSIISELQAVVNRPGFAGDAVIVLVRDNANGSLTYFSRHGHAWSGLTTSSKLNATYSGGGGGGGGPPKKCTHCIGVGIAI